MRKIIMTVLLFLSIFPANATASFSRNYLSGLPDKEKYVYISDNSKKDPTVMILYTEIIQDPVNGDVWKLRSVQTNKSEISEEISYMRLSDLQLISNYSRTEYPGKGSYENSYTLNELKIKNHSEEEFTLASMSGMIYLFRFYPFEKDIQKIQLNTLSGNNGMFQMHVKNNGLKKIKIDGENTEAYELEVGVDSIINKFFPKTRFYFSSDRKKKLIKYGSYMGGGNGDMILKEYDFE